ncbi:MAG TPA: B12-binding domain-containing protein [Pyrinomonadaceae bacterium]|jgi:excisionase family DNA binding protein
MRQVSETNYLTTKEVARLCRVSDATVKRWEDAGLLKSERTSGKHRRFRAEEVARFQREQGLGQKTCHGDRSVQNSVARRKNLACSSSTLFDLLASGCEEETANFMIGAFLQGAALTDIFDNLLSPAMQRIGELWYQGELSVTQEHLATRAAHYAVHKLRASLPLPEMNGKTAFCAAMEGDLHELPSYLAQVAIENEGWEVMNFGANTPLFSLTEEILQYAPSAVCLSSTYMTELERLSRDYKTLREHAHKLKIPLILGGKMFEDDHVRRRFPADLYARTFAEVAHFIERLSA